MTATVRNQRESREPSVLGKGTWKKRREGRCTCRGRRSTKDRRWLNVPGLPSSQTSKQGGKKDGRQGKNVIEESDNNRGRVANGGQGGAVRQRDSVAAGTYRL